MGRIVQSTTTVPCETWCVLGARDPHTYCSRFCSTCEGTGTYENGHNGDDTDCVCVAGQKLSEAKAARYFSPPCNVPGCKEHISTDRSNPGPYYCMRHYQGYEDMSGDLARALRDAEVEVDRVREEQAELERIKEWLRP